MMRSLLSSVVRVDTAMHLLIEDRNESSVLGRQPVLSNLPTAIQSDSLPTALCLSNTSERPGIALDRNEDIQKLENNTDQEEVPSLSQVLLSDLRAAVGQLKVVFEGNMCLGT